MPGRTVGNTLTQQISRYGRLWSLTQSFHLLQEDRSFSVPGQWYGGASFGILQIWPANADFLIQTSGLGSQLRGLYDPRKDPATALFDPNVALRFGGAADTKLRVRDETKQPYAYEQTQACSHDTQSPPFNECTWARFWARRMAAFNRGSDDVSGSSPRPFTNYGSPIIANSVSYLPQP